jgi:hypothetical protein
MKQKRENKNKKKKIKREGKGKRKRKKKELLRTRTVGHSRDSVVAHTLPPMVDRRKQRNCFEVVLVGHTKQSCNM